MFDDTKSEKVKSMRGGAREGAGRPKQESIRANHALRAYDDEWEIIKAFATIVKKDRARAERILRTK